MENLFETLGEILKPEKNKLQFTDIIQDLKSRGEYNIRFEDDGYIYSNHGKATLNVWAIKDNELICIDCRTIYHFSI
jgi:hypothetical protein